VQDGAPVSSQDNTNIINANDWPTFRSLLEDKHDITHGFIGGTIGDPHTSFRDPFVFLLHSNVDRLFAMWQLQPSHAERLDPNRVYGNETRSKGRGDVEDDTQNFGILSPIMPWASPEAQTSETGIVEHVKKTRPWAPPENMDQVKDSRAVVIPRRYDTT
jgi:hypothetical protein